MWRRLLLFSAAASMASAQGALSGPSLGWFFDPHAQALRRIWGIPGSATAGESLDLGFPVVNATLSSAQDYALVTAGDGSVTLVSLDPTGIAVRPVAGLPAAPDRILASPSGSAAAFAYGASIRILTGLPGSVDRLEEIDASSLPGPPNALAISDDGAVLLASVPDNAQTSASGGVFVFDRGDSGPHLIAPKMASDLSFFAASHDALLTDEIGNSVTLLADVGGNATVRWVFMDDRLPAPSMAKPSLDRQRILVGSARSNSIAVLDLDGGNPVIMPCACSPDRAGPLNNGVYQLTDPGKDLLWILDLSQGPQLFFVPISEASGTSPGASQ
ncbi:MAG TPA: hypothetical protein VGQ49_08235 [Bryobacteraceae bacterium]|nr:hypothetical protein [Bryobacteraceae bacterium]